ncbi:MAG: hypothetical protein Q8S27_04340 [Hoeflea sp.]|uniref:hypothetical protein n=1 Tax=Hoeflea sp. TaxID=1940281 RepID=UPI0027311B34|nr:hypothetical protein [Hoeflea sp.]MDP2120324.1 hypothetical protein [Hoeflea sp.]MDP3523783.1 hypothetical protein [Hoeflea sp.]
MAFWVSNPMAFLADFVAPLIIGFVFAYRWGAARGTAYAVVPLLVVVLVLFVLQVSPGINPDGSTRLESALSYMRFDAVIWVPVFAVGVALGWAFARNRRGGARG